MPKYNANELAVVESNEELKFVEAAQIVPHSIIRHKRSGKLYYILSVEHWNNILTGERSHAKVLDDKNKVKEFGFDFIRSEFYQFANL